MTLRYLLLFLVACRTTSEAPPTTAGPTDEELVRQRIHELSADPLFAELGMGGELVILLEAEDVFRVETLQQIAVLSEELERRDDVRRIESLATRDVIRAVDDEIRIDPFYKAVEQLPDSAAKKRLLLSNSWGRSLVGPDGKTTLVFVYRSDFSRSEELQKVVLETVPTLKPVLYDLLRATVPQLTELGAKVTDVGAIHVRIEAPDPEGAITDEAITCLRHVEQQIGAIAPDTVPVSLLSPLSIMQREFSRDAPVMVDLTPGAVRQFLLLLSSAQSRLPVAPGMRALVITVPVTPASRSHRDLRQSVSAVRCSGFALSQH